MGLQRFTNSDLEGVPSDTEQRYKDIILRILNGEIIVKDPEAPMPGVTGQELETATNIALNYLQNEAWDVYYETQVTLLTADGRSQIWQGNHSRIRSCISSVISECGRLPTHMEISYATGLSRQTIHKHLKSFDQHDEYNATLNQYRFMSTKILDKVYRLAMDGDTKAAKLYLQVVGGVPGLSNQLNGVTNQQNNYIQVNGMMLTEDIIELLTDRQLHQLERIIKHGLRKKVELKRCNNNQE